MATRWIAFVAIAAVITQSLAVKFCETTCPYLMADSVWLNISYTNQCEDTKTYGINITGGTPSCICTSTNSNLTLTGNDSSGVLYTVNFLYAQVGTTWTTTVLFNVTLDYVPHINANSCVGYAMGSMLPNTTYLGSQVAAQNGFKCSQVSVGSNGTSCSTVQFANITMKNWSVKPFFGSSSNYQSCSPDITSIIVPIAVGAALAGLVVLVIVVWVAGKLWERYKAKKNGVSYDKL